jgi:hypothetical protein
MQRYRGQIRVAVVAGLVLYLGACVAWQELKPGSKKQARGMIFEHGFHEAMELACTDCHDTSLEGESLIPTHDLCSLCHEISLEAPTQEACGLCHSDPEFKVIARELILSDEVIFSHTPHIVAEVDCATCHPNPNEGTLGAGPVMENCMDCHAQVNVAALTGPEAVEHADMNACEVCHTELSLETTPKFRSGERIPHDSPAVWALVHGRESLVDRQYCANCHEEEAFCVDCHRTTPPDDHTATWRRSTHGLHATWDRATCAVCHEEDSCVKCHRDTEPRSHRGGFGSPRNNHCVQCHMPIEENNCAVCHESIEHRDAPTSPHNIGLFPANCTRCHPIGAPGRAPHVTNATARCADCHG